MTTDLDGTMDFPPPVKPSEDVKELTDRIAGFLCTGGDPTKTRWRKAHAIIAAALERLKGEAAEDAATVTANEWQESVDSWLAEKDDRIAELEAEVAELCRLVREKDLRIAALEYQKEQGDV